MQSCDTDNLLLRAQAGDVSAQECLLARYRDRLRRVVEVFLDPRLSARVDPSDVLQEALTQAARQLPDYLAERPVDFYSWLRSLVRDELIRLHRRHLLAQRRSVSREQPLGCEITDASAQVLADRLVSAESSPSKRASDRELVKEVRAALRELSDDDREILLMRCVEQLPIREISAVISISETAVKGRLRRALERIGRQLRSQP